MNEETSLYSSIRYPGLRGYHEEHLWAAERRLEKARSDHTGTLDLAQLNLVSLPEEVWGGLCHLRVLYLSHNYLSALPVSIARLTGLQELRLNGNDFEQLPDFLAPLSGLKMLEVNHNRLQSLPDVFGGMPELQTLDAACNHLRELPASAASLLQLRELALGSNRLSAVPDCLTKFARLERLGLQNNQLATLLGFLGGLRSLKELHVGENALAAFPSECGELTQLQTLDLHNNQLTCLPDAVTKLTALKTLVVYGNQLTRLPEEIGRLGQLRELLLTGNRLQSLPASLGELHRLERLSLYNNALESLPDTLGGLTSLKSLHLNSNRLRSLPRSIGKLLALRELRLFDNELTALPQELLDLARCGTLKELFLHGNDALDLPEAILGEHWEAATWKEGKPTPPVEILKYYFALLSGPARTLRELKVILVGRGEVGKTTLAEALQGKPFEKHRPMTRGISITPWELDLKDGIENGRATAYLWDFGGQKIMHGTHQFFMTHRALYLLVLDGRDDRTRQEAEYWLKLVRAFGGEASPVMLVLNKQGECPYEIDGEYFVKKYGILPQHIFRTECADPENPGIAALRCHISEAAARLLADRELFPGAWWEMKNHLADMKKRREDFLSEEEYHELCRVLKVPAEQCGGLLRALSELGVVVSFPEDVSLAHLLVLNPEWVTDGVYRVLNDPELREKKRGQLTLAALERILPASRWKKPGHRKYILDLMAKFELCFPMEGRHSTVLVPELLEDATPPILDTWRADECAVFLYRYPALPQGVLPRLITRTHGLSEGHARWRSGVVLERQGATALVRADYDRNELGIWVKGRPGPVTRELMAIIRDHLDAIHEPFENLGAEALLTVPGQPEVTVLLQDVLADEEAGERTMRLTIDGTRREVAIKDLLEGVDIKNDRKKRKLSKEIDAVKKRSPAGKNVFNIEKAFITQAGEAHTHMHEEHKNTRVILAAGATLSGIVGDHNSVQGSTGNTQTFTHCFETLQQLPDDQTEIKAAMSELVQAAQALVAQLDEKAQAKLQKNLEMLTQEAAAKEPDTTWLQASGKGLIEAAQTCAAMAGPVVAATKKVLELFL